MNKKVDLLLDLERWQALFDALGSVFEPLVPGARLGILRRTDSEAMHGTVLVCEAQRDGVLAGLELFEGYERLAVDILFVSEKSALATLHGSTIGETIKVMKRLIHEGAVIFFVMKRGKVLRILGYDALLESLGLAFLGACR